MPSKYFVELENAAFILLILLSNAEDPQTIEYKVGEVFTEIKNNFRSGYILRDVNAGEAKFEWHNDHRSCF